MNWALLAAVLLCVLGFGSSAKMAGAYGLAVTATMVVTTLLMWLVFREWWLWPSPLALAVFLPLLGIDLAFFTANLPKLLEGGWLTVLIGGVLLLVMTTWRRGRERLSEAIAQVSRARADFAAQIEERPPARTPGCAVFLTRSEKLVPLALLNNLRFNGVLHERVVLLTVHTARKPYVDAESRLRVTDLGQGLFSLNATYGFMERAHIPELIGQWRPKGAALESDRITYFLSRETVIVRHGGGFSRWRGRLFAFLARNGQSATEFFSLPAERVVEMGAQVDL